MAAPPPPPSPPVDMEQMEWLSDYIVSVLKSPTWVLPLADFVDERCHTFDDSEENKLEYTACHNEYKHLVGDLFACHLLEVSVTPEQFAAFCQRGLSEHAELHRALVEQLLSVDDFLTFKAMMAKHNADLDRQAVYTLDYDDEEEAATSPGAAIASDLVAQSLATAHGQAAGEAQGEDDWHLYEDQLLKAIEASKQEADDDARLADLRCEEAELQQVIALSLQLEEERLRLLVEEEAAAVAAAGGAGASNSGAPLPPESPPSPEPELPETAGFVTAPLMPVYRSRPVAADFNTTTASVLSVASVQAEDTVVPRLLKMGAMDASGKVPASSCVANPTPAPAPGAAGVFTSMPLMKAVPPQQSSSPEPAPEAPAPPPPAPPAAAAEPEVLPPPRPQLGALKAPNVQEMRKRLEACRVRADKALTTPAAAPLKYAAPAPGTAEAGSPPPVAQPPAPPAPAGLPSTDERRQRAEHLKKQRDRLLQKRRLERDQQLTDFQRGRQQPGAAAGGAIDAGSSERTLSQDQRAKAGRRLVAELTPGAVVATETAPPLADTSGAAEMMRQALTLQLRQTLVHSIDMDASVLGNQLSQLEARRDGK
eukprot:TRINITY_DN17020_c0_g1_i1.p1 TRINITY_DN17020_c0_g1~~TRINITY_DN17020_c0_g1_i1.p1  ORF type:complete len:595 (+),score=194.08 TRINITY_DN17020_c0_g1_i1:92-1876(+)